MFETVQLKLIDSESKTTGQMNFVLSQSEFFESKVTI